MGFIHFILFFPIFLYEVFINEFSYTSDEIILSISSMLLIIIAIMFIGKGLYYGNAGPV